MLKDVGVFPKVGRYFPMHIFVLHPAQHPNRPLARNASIASSHLAELAGEGGLTERRCTSPHDSHGQHKAKSVERNIAPQG